MILKCIETPKLAPNVGLDFMFRLLGLGRDQKSDPKKRFPLIAHVLLKARSTMQVTRSLHPPFRLPCACGRSGCGGPGLHHSL